MRKIFAFGTVLCVCLGFVFAVFFSKNLFFPTKFNNYVAESCERFSLPQSLVFAVIKCESSFNPNAVSRRGAIGLMQVMPQTAQYMNNKYSLVEQIDLFESECNIMIGCAYLYYLFEKFENVDVVICAYNAGEGEVKNWLGEDGKLKYILFPETQNYYNKVHFAQNVYENI